ncbi:MAG: putative quinol monooxygenase [Bdellovibrionota bacterium]
MVILAVKIKVKADKVLEAEKFFSLFPQRAQSEKGCLQYELFRVPTDSQLFYFFEKWATQEEFNEHSSQPYLKEFASRYSEILECPNEVLFLENFNLEPKV